MHVCLLMRVRACVLSKWGINRTRVPARVRLPAEGLVHNSRAGVCPKKLTRLLMSQTLKSISLFVCGNDQT